MNVNRFVPIFRSAVKLGGAQSAFNDAWGWWRADNVSGSSPTMAFADLSGNSRTMNQTAGTLTAGTSANGQARVTGNSTATLTAASGALAAWPMTVITVCKRTAAALCGMFGASGASSFNNHWFGWEGSNELSSYNSNRAIHTDSTGGTTGCYASRVGYGSRVQLINGIIQEISGSGPANMGLASIARATAVAPAIGTTYRGLNCEWQETLCWNRLLTLAEIDEVHAYINARYGLTIPLWSSYTPVKMVWIGGQSNAHGFGDRGVSDANIPAEYDAALSNCKVWYGTPVGNVGTAFESLDINVPNHMLNEPSQQGAYVGPMLTLAKEYTDRIGETVYFMNNGKGSSMLEYAGLSASHWDFTDNTPVQNSTFRMAGFTGQNWWASLRAHQSATRKPELVGCFWYQGEQDCLLQVNADAYHANMIAFPPLLEAELGVSYGKFLMCRIHSGIDIGIHPYREKVRAAQLSASAAIRDCTLISTDSYTLRDTAHLNIAGILDLGNVAQLLI